MQYSKDITDILEDTINSMVYTLTINSITDNGDGTQTLNCCDIFYSQKGFKIKLHYTNNGGGVKYYIITDFSQANETITITTTDTIDVKAGGLMYPIHFYHGTPIATDIELTQITDASNKTPMVWLWENFKENNSIDITPVAREINVELYFLTQPPTELQLMMTDDSYTQMIQPMRRLLELFIAKIGETNNYFNMDFNFDYDTENFAKFGVMARNKGTDKKILFDNLAGVGMKIKLKLWDNTACSVC